MCAPKEETGSAPRGVKQVALEALVAVEPTYGAILGVIGEYKHISIVNVEVKSDIQEP